MPISACNFSTLIWRVLNGGVVKEGLFVCPAGLRCIAGCSNIKEFLRCLLFWVIAEPDNIFMHRFQDGRILCAGQGKTENR